MEIRNNVQSPNFGMAFKIKDVEGMRQELSYLPNLCIDALKSAGKILGKEGEPGATKYYHVVVDLNKKGEAFAKLDAGEDAYFGPFKQVIGGSEYRGKYGENENIIMLSEESNGNNFAGVARYAHDGERPEFNVWGSNPWNSPVDVLNLAHVAKILDQIAAQKAYEQANKLAQPTLVEVNRANVIDLLMSEFGVK